MANEQELTGMDLFKVLLDRDKKKLPMSEDERRWFNEQKRASEKYRNKIGGI